MVSVAVGVNNSQNSPNTIPASSVNLIYPRLLVLFEAKVCILFFKLICLFSEAVSIH